MSEATTSQPSGRQDLIGGTLSVAFGAFALMTGAGYPIGSLLRMGPGFFPSLIAILIILLGLAMIAAAFRSTSQQTGIDVRFRSALMIGLGILLFALLLERAGLVPATVVLVLVSSLAEPRWRAARAAVLAVAMTALVYLIFIVVLQIPVAAVNL